MKKDNRDESSLDSLQVIDSLLFHEYTVIDRQVCKVTRWLPHSRKPELPGRYQALIELKNGEKAIEDHQWTGKFWVNLRTGRRTAKKFHWRGAVEKS
jgi:hypothetical protein